MVSHSGTLVDRLKPGSLIFLGLCRKNQHSSGHKIRMGDAESELSPTGPTLYLLNIAAAQRDNTARLGIK